MAQTQVKDGLATTLTLLIRAVRSSGAVAVTIMDCMPEYSVLAATTVVTPTIAVSVQCLGASTLNLSLCLGTFYRHRIKVFKYGKLRVISLKVE